MEKSNQTSQKSLIELSKTLKRDHNKIDRFLHLYDELFKDFRDKKIRLLEIGVQNGGSVELWSKYFNKAEIIGLDTLNIPPIEGVTLVKGNQLDFDLLDELGDFDIIIDDGGHKVSEQIGTFNFLKNKLKRNGLYIIEDLETSYLKIYRELIDYPMTTIDFFLEKINKLIRGDKDLKQIIIEKDIIILKNHG